MSKFLHLSIYFYKIYALNLGSMIEIFLSFLIFGFLGIVLVLMNKLLGPKRSNPTKEKPFECGSPYLQEEINPVPIKF